MTREKFQDLPFNLDEATEEEAVKDKAKVLFDSLPKVDIGKEKNRALLGLLELEVFALLFYGRGRQVGIKLVIKELFKKLDITPLKVIGKDDEEAIRVAIEALSQPSLPSNLDEAAEEWVRPIMRIPSKAYEFLYTYLIDAFKKGAEWMARQRESIESTVVTTQDEDTCRPYLALQNFGYMPAPIFCKESDEVIVQIRKKQ